MKITETPIVITDGVAIDFSEQQAVLDIQTDKRYWRSSKLLRVDFVVKRQGAPCQISYWMEEEADEYDMLLSLSEDLKDIRQIITFNGQAFDLPHLKHKYEAYGLPNPFNGKEHIDLFLAYKPLYRLFGLAGRHLSDYAALLQLPDADDAVLTFALLSLNAVLHFFENESWTLCEAARDKDHLYYRLDTKEHFPKRLSLHDEIYHLIMEEHTALLSVKIIDGNIRRYYTDVKNYVYLPLEGYAMHKSMASYVEKEHKKKAVRQNCFSLTSYSELFLTDEKRIRSYLITALQFLQSR